MEQEKLEEARRTFSEDCDRFDKYMNEMATLAEQAKERSEKAGKDRLRLNEKVEKL